MKFKFLFALLFAPLSLTAAIDVSVSDGGSLAAARDSVRAKRAAGENGPAVITVDALRLEMTAPLTLEAQDSDLTIQPAAGKSALLLGGTVVTGFTKHQGDVMKADVSSFVKPGTKLRQLFFDDKRMTLARYPNADAADPLYGGWAFVEAFPASGAPAGHDWKSTLFVKPQDVRTWAHPEDVEIDIFAQYGWWNFVMPVKSLDTTSRLLTLAKPCSYDLHPHNRYHFQNALEELDAPGEWFLDPRTSTLYFWPPAPMSGKEVRLVTLGSFFEIKAGAKNVRITGLGFTACNNTAITMSNATDCSVLGCKFDQVGDFNGSAINLNGGSNNEARSNEISYSGSTGINLNGGDRATLTPTNNKATNNHIHHMGVFNKNACGVGAFGVGHVIAHNDIHDGPRMGVQMSGNNIIVEYNHLHHLCMETQDGGAIYTGGRDWLGGRGSVWRYNRIHDVVGCGQEATGLKHPWFTFGLYPDDNTGGVDIIGNLVYRIAKSPIHLHNSRDCLVENNIFALGGAYQFDLHGWRKEDNFFKSHFDSMVKGYESVSGQPAWKAMRGMELHPRDAIRDDGTMASGDIIQRNIMFSSSPDSKYGDLRNVTPKWNTIDKNLVWNGGLPIVTGLNKTGPDQGPALLEEKFNAAKPNETPKGWGFNARPQPTLKLIVVDGVLQADCGTSDDPKQNHTTFHGPDIPAKAGTAYRAHFRIKSTEPTSTVHTSLAMFKNGGGYWQGKSNVLAVTSQWQEVEASATLPAQTSATWKPWMTDFWLRLDCMSPTGQILIDDVRIYEAAPLNEWASWQAEGWDKSSVVADPLFMDVTKDDFRLKPDSPAFKLGFKQLPIEKMGQISDEWLPLP